MVPDEASSDVGKRIIIVDDDDSLCLSLARILARQGGYHVDTACSGREGLEKAGRQVFDVAVLDIKLPDMAGVDLIGLLRETNPDIGLIMVTGFASMESAVRALNEGATAYVTKPYNVDEVLGIIRVILDRQRLQAENRRLFQAAQTELAARQRAEGALLESERRYRSLFENSPVGLYVSTPGGQILDANSTLWRTLGYPDRDSLLAVDLGDFYLDPEDRRRALEILDRDGVLLDFETRMRRADGKVVWMLDSARVVGEADGSRRHYEGSLRDITERRRLESQFIAAQKMETVGRLAGGVAHQFNNVLTAVLGYADLAKRALPPGDPVRDDIDVVLRGSERLAKLTQELLSFSRRQMIQPAPLNLSELVRGLEGVLDALPGERIERVMRLAPDLGRVQADRGRLEQVVLNLAANAHDAMPDGGRLTLETANVTLDDTGDLPAGDYVRLTVSDTGVGMSAEVQAHLFEPFFTTKGVGEGTGLALAAAYGIVRQHGGDLRVVSTPGEGARFEVYLPRLPA